MRKTFRNDYIMKYILVITPYRDNVKIKITVNAKVESKSLQGLSEVAWKLQPEPYTSEC